MNPVEMCDLVACWVESVPTKDLSGTRTGAVGLTGHSVQGWVQHAGVVAGCLSGCWRAEADGLH